MAQTPEGHREYCRAYYAAHKEAIKARKAAWYMYWQPRIRQQQRAWYQANKTKKKAYVKTYYATHTAQIRAYRRAYYQRRKAEKLARQTSRTQGDTQL